MEDKKCKSCNVIVEHEGEQCNMYQIFVTMSIVNGDPIFDHEIICFDCPLPYQKPKKRNKKNRK